MICRVDESDLNKIFLEIKREVIRETLKKKNLYISDDALEMIELDSGYSNYLSRTIDPSLLNLASYKARVARILFRILRVNYFRQFFYVEQ